jgi:hypothetical protein
MKPLLVIVTLSLLLFPGRSYAVCDCKEPPKPELPAGLADNQEMEKSGKEIDAYVKVMRQYRDCLMKCVYAADNDLSSVISGWNYSVDKYNASSNDKATSSK